MIALFDSEEAYKDDTPVKGETVPVTERLA